MTTASRPRGRPRDPEVEPKVFAAAIALYAERGWSGFSVESVARSAGVGQAAVYRRWSSKAQLLGDAVRAGSPDVPEIDTGSSREDLLALGRHLLDSYREPVGVVGLRLVLDARSVPELAEQFDVMLTGERARAVREVVVRADRRGDLLPSVDVALEVLTGATLSRVLFDTRVRSDRARRDSDRRFLEALVETLLA